VYELPCACSGSNFAYISSMSHTCCPYTSALKFRSPIRAHYKLLEIRSLPSDGQIWDLSLLKLGFLQAIADKIRARIYTLDRDWDMRSEPKRFSTSFSGKLQGPKQNLEQCMVISFGWSLHPFGVWYQPYLMDRNPIRLENLWEEVCARTHDRNSTLAVWSHTRIRRLQWWW
jgi:hypothetical protein